MQSNLNRKYPKKNQKYLISKKSKNILYQKNPKISYIQKSFVISQKNLFVPKIRKRIFLPGQQQGQEEGQQEELS